uniref:Uncharacterized protein n=1 Tax=Populus davidiana TaxID=266767 RepID=A0A6M2EGH0_9ROSI
MTVVERELTNSLKIGTYHLQPRLYSDRHSGRPSGPATLYPLPPSPPNAGPLLRPLYTLWREPRRILLISESIMNSKSKLESAMEYKGTSPSISGSEILAPQLFVLSSIIVNNNDDNVRADKERLFIVSLLCFASSFNANL